MTKRTPRPPSDDLGPRERRALVDEYLAERNPEAVLFDGLDHALLGIASQFTNPPLAVYDYGALIEGFMADGMTHQEAHEHLSYNIEGLWAGKGTPLILEGVDRL